MTLQQGTNHMDRRGLQAFASCMYVGACARPVGCSVRLGSLQTKRHKYVRESTKFICNQCPGMQTIEQGHTSATCNMDNVAMGVTCSHLSYEAHHKKQTHACIVHAIMRRLGTVHLEYAQCFIRLDATNPYTV